MENNNLDKAKSWTTWFEIPVTNFDRAKTFYENIFQTSIETMDFGPLKMGIFPHKNVGCAICQGESYVPSQSGALVYLNANPNLNGTLELIEKNGGKILQPKKLISEDHGYLALFLDTEGNRMALHSDQ